jgi:hypothetical protein
LFVGSDELRSVRLIDQCHDDRDAGLGGRCYTRTIRNNLPAHWAALLAYDEKQVEVDPARIAADQAGGATVGLEAFALEALALHLAGTANRLGGLARTALGWLLEMPAQLHLTEDTFPLHLLLERLQRLIDVVVTNENLHLAAFSFDPG